MARRTVTTIAGDDVETTINEQVQDAVAQIMAEQPAEETPDDVALSALLAEFTSDEDSTIRIYRQGAHAKELTYIDECAPSAFSVKMLKYPPYNGGKFRLYGANRGKLVFNRMLHVEPAPAQPIAIQQPQPDITSAITPVMDTLRELQAQNQALINSLLQNALAPKPVESRASMMQEIVAMMSMIKELMGSGGQKSTMEALRENVGLLNELKTLTGDGDGSPMMALAAQLMPKLIDAASTQAQLSSQISAAQNVPQVQYSPNPSSAIEEKKMPLADRIEPSPEDQLEVAALQGLIPILINAARKNLEPALYAELVADSMPAETLDMMHRPDWFDLLVQSVPAFAPYKDWLGRLHKEILALFTAEEDESIPGGNAPVSP